MKISMLQTKPPETRILTLSDPAFDPHLYQQSLALRFNYFVEQQRWNLPTYGKLETDQYDTLFSRHILAMRGNEVIGTIRLLPTTHNLFGTTYMILDAHRGKLPDLPANLMEYEIICPMTYEASRMAISNSVDMKDRNAVVECLIRSAQNHISELGGNRMLGLMNPVFKRFFRRLGIDCTEFSPRHNLPDGPICTLLYDF